MDSIADVTAPEAALAIPRFEDGFVNMQELLRQLAESVVNEIMSARPASSAGRPATAGTATASAGWSRAWGR